MRVILSLVLVFLMAPAIVTAQTVTTGALSARYCHGDVVAVSFTTTGAFAPGNAFIAQLSDSAGSFVTGFRNLGSIPGGGAGAINITIPGEARGTGYRVRVIASNPVVHGTDNGADIALGPRAQAAFESLKPFATMFHDRWLTTGMEISFNNYSTDVDTSHWDFGDGATPATFIGRQPPPVTYATPGTKTVTLTGISSTGCLPSVTYSMSFEVASSSNGVIPADAITVSDQRMIDRRRVGGDSADIPIAIWVCPGGDLTFKNEPKEAVIYVEAGGNVLVTNVGERILVYAKAGASVSVGGAPYCTVVYETGGAVNVVGSGKAYLKTFETPSLVFDYTNAPAGGCPSLAPYTRRLPVDVRNVTGKKKDDENSATFWVRNGGELAASGTGNTYAVEEGGRVTATGNNSVVYMKSGGTFDASGTSGNRIFHELGAVIVNAGDGAALFPSSGITFVYEGPSSVLFEPGVSASKLLMVPNPAQGSVRIGSVDGSVLESVSLWNTLGERVLEREVGGVAEVDLSLAGITAGVYYVHVGTQRGVLIEKLVVR